MSRPNRAWSFGGDPEAAMLDLCTKEKRGVFDEHVRFCESPIERIALACLLAISPCVLAAPAAMIPEVEDWQMVVVPQARVGPFRLDFAVHGHHCIYALECDGREFHRDHQADNERSIELWKFGVLVYRVSGSSLYRNPISALEPLVDMALAG